MQYDEYPIVYTTMFLRVIVVVTNVVLDFNDNVIVVRRKNGSRPQLTTRTE